ncbi:MAG: hypothetical protein V1796_02700 [Pseudomonadota bacterium]
MLQAVRALGKSHAAMPGARLTAGEPVRQMFRSVSANQTFGAQSLHFFYPPTMFDRRLNCIGNMHVHSYLAVLDSNAVSYKHNSQSDFTEILISERT